MLSTAAAPTVPAAPAGHRKVNAPTGLGVQRAGEGAIPSCLPPCSAPEHLPLQQHHPSPAPAWLPGTLPGIGVPLGAGGCPPKSIAPTWGCSQSRWVCPYLGTPPCMGTTVDTQQRQGARPDSSGVFCAFASKIRTAPR